MEKFKVRIMRPCRIAIVVDDKVVRADCQEGQDVYVEKIFMEDIRDNIYRPYKSNILGSDGIPMRQRKRERVPKNKKNENHSPTPGAVNIQQKVSQSVKSLQTAIQGATEVIKILQNMEGQIKEEDEPEPIKATSEESGKPAEKKIEADENNIPENAFIEEGQTVVSPYNEQNYNTHHSRMKSVIRNTLNIDDDSGERGFISFDHTKKHLPKFSELNRSREDMTGEIFIDKDPRPVAPDILGNTPTKVNLVNDEKGEVDVIKTLGLKIG